MPLRVLAEGAERRIPQGQADLSLEPWGTRTPRGFGFLVVTLFD
jgi:hypothetical protein